MFQFHSNIVTIKIPHLDESKLSKGITILSEINMEAIYFFAGKPFVSGQIVLIEFLVPKHFIVSAQIVYCRPVNLKSRIISENKLPYRLGASFPFLQRGERTLLRQFVASIEPDLSSIAAAKEEGDAGGGDTDFSDFEDL